MAADAPATQSLLTGRPLRILVALILIVNGMFPALWILFTSLKTEAELTAKPITWLPHAPTLANYFRAFTDQPLLLFLFNSFMVAILSTALTLLVSVLAAYALARLQIRGTGLDLVRDHRGLDISPCHPSRPAVRDHARTRSAEYLDRTHPTLHRPQSAGLHADPRLLL